MQEYLYIFVNRIYIQLQIQLQIQLLLRQKVHITKMNTKNSNKKLFDLQIQIEGKEIQLTIYQHSNLSEISKSVCTYYQITNQLEDRIQYIIRKNIQNVLHDNHQDVILKSKLQKIISYKTPSLFYSSILTDQNFELESNNLSDINEQSLIQTKYKIDQFFKSKSRIKESTQKLSQKILKQLYHNSKITSVNDQNSQKKSQSLQKSKKQKLAWFKPLQISDNKEMTCVIQQSSRNLNNNPTKSVKVQKKQIQPKKFFSSLQHYSKQQTVSRTVSCDKFPKYCQKNNQLNQIIPSQIFQKKQSQSKFIELQREMELKKKAFNSIFKLLQINNNISHCSFSILEPHIHQILTPIKLHLNQRKSMVNRTIFLKLMQLTYKNLNMQQKQILLHSQIRKKTAKYSHSKYSDKYHLKKKIKENKIGQNNFYKNNNQIE